MIEQKTTSETQSKNKDDSSSRFVGTDSLVDVYSKATPFSKKINDKYKKINNKGK